MITLDERYLWLAYKEGEEKEEVFCDKLTRMDNRWILTNVKCDELRSFYRKYPISDSVQLCAHYFYGPREMIKWTMMYKTINKSYVVIGSSACGDFIAIPRVRWNSIGYISHDKFGYDENENVPFIAVSRSIGKFYYNSWHKKDWPDDYYDAITQKGEKW